MGLPLVIAGSSRRLSTGPLDTSADSPLPFPASPICRQGVPTMSSHVRTAAVRLPNAANVTFLRAAPDLDSILDFDQWQRYSAVARCLDRLCAGLSGPIRVLDVGCNVLNLLPCFLDCERVQVIRCDSLPNDSGDPDYAQIEPNKPLPFEDGSFDAVAALEVLEHVPRDRREFFLADCLRIARRGAVFTCPNGTPAVAAAEQLAANAYHERHGQPHPFLSEHHEFGLPSEAEVRAILERLDVPHAVVPNAPLDVWLASIVLSEQLLEKAHDPAVRRELVRAFQDLPSSVHEHYRNIYVSAKSFEGSGALDASSTPLARF